VPATRKSASLWTALHRHAKERRRLTEMQHGTSPDIRRKKHSAHAQQRHGIRSK
jgi:hypothetical protein